MVEWHEGKRGVKEDSKGLGPKDWKKRVSMFKVRKAVEEAVGAEEQSSILEHLCLRCLIDIQEEMLNRKIDVGV